MEKLKAFWQEYRTIIVGAGAALYVALSEIINKPQEEQSVKVYVFAGVLAVGGYLSKNLRGQTATTIGLVITGLSTWYASQETPNFTWWQFGVQVLGLYLAAVAAPPKPLTYETNRAIEEAKEIPAVDQVKDDAPNPIKKAPKKTTLKIVPKNKTK